MVSPGASATWVAPFELHPVRDGVVPVVTGSALAEVPGALLGAGGNPADELALATCLDGNVPAGTGAGKADRRTVGWPERMLEGRDTDRTVDPDTEPV